MLQTPVSLDSKLPSVGTTIFTVMSRLATECGAINLSQGFPDFQPDTALFEATLRAMREGRNQYPPMSGVSELRMAIAEKVSALYDAQYDVEQEITVTAGATQAIFTAIAAFVRCQDEVIVFAPPSTIVMRRPSSRSAARRCMPNSAFPITSLTGRKCVR